MRSAASSDSRAELSELTSHRDPVPRVLGDGSRASSTSSTQHSTPMDAAQADSPTSIRQSPAASTGRRESLKKVLSLGSWAMKKVIRGAATLVGGFVGQSTPTLPPHASGCDGDDDSSGLWGVLSKESEGIGEISERPFGSGSSEPAAASSSTTSFESRQVEEVRMRALRAEANRRLHCCSALRQSRKLGIHVASWNVAQQQPPDCPDSLRPWVLGAELTDKLREAAQSRTQVPLDQFPDVVVVGLQEVEFGGIALVVETTESSVAWMEAVTDCLNHAVEWRVRYKKLRTVQLVGIVLIVIVRANHEPFVNHIKTSLSRTGAMSGVMGNKGSIALRMTLYGKRLLFVCAHFHPHLQNAKTRMRNYHNALAELRFESLHPDADDAFDVVRFLDEAHRRLDALHHADGGMSGGTTVRQSERTEGQSAWSRFFSLRARSGNAAQKERHALESHDYVFFFGDLNYRLHGIQGADIRARLSDAKRASPLDFESLVDTYDELRDGMRRKKIFRGFEESPVTFPPTYKYDIGSDVLDTSSKRRDPAWTDRILYRVWNETHPHADLRIDAVNDASLTSLPSVRSVGEGDEVAFEPSTPLPYVAAATRGSSLRGVVGAPTTPLLRNSSVSPLPSHWDDASAAVKNDRGALGSLPIPNGDDVGGSSGGTSPLVRLVSPAPPLPQEDHGNAATTEAHHSSPSPQPEAAVEQLREEWLVPNRLHALEYQSVPLLRLSDHKPILGRFSVTVLSASKESIQEAMLSCRDIWDFGHCDDERAHL